MTIRTDRIVRVAISVLQGLATGQCLDVRKSIRNIRRGEHRVCSFVQSVGGLRLIVAAIASGGYHRVVARAVVCGAHVYICALVLPVRVGKQISTAVTALVGTVRRAGSSRRR